MPFFFSFCSRVLHDIQWSGLFRLLVAVAVSRTFSLLMPSSISMRTAQVFCGVPRYWDLSCVFLLIRRGSKCGRQTRRWSAVFMTPFPAHAWPTRLMTVAGGFSHLPGVVFVWVLPEKWFLLSPCVLYGLEEGHPVQPSPTEWGLHSLSLETEYLHIFLGILLYGRVVSFHSY